LLPENMNRSPLSAFAGAEGAVLSAADECDV